VQSEEGSAGVAVIGLPSVRERQAMLMRESLSDIAKRYEGRLLIGLTEVTSLSAAAIADLVMLSGACRRMGGKLVLFGVSRHILDSIRSAGLHRSLDIASDRAEAAEWIRGKPPRTGRLMGLWSRRPAA
jgi:anti-anti-sigma factor